MRNELIRKELEKKFTHVTFVRTINNGRPYEVTQWFVNDEMKEIYIRTEWEIDEILFQLEVNELAKIANIYSEKYATFKYLMKIGKLPLDHTRYKKTTLKKLEELL